MATYERGVRANSHCSSSSEEDFVLTPGDEPAPLGSSPFLPLLARDLSAMHLGTNAIPKQPSDGTVGPAKPSSRLFVDSPSSTTTTPDSKQFFDPWAPHPFVSSTSSTTTHHERSAPSHHPPRSPRGSFTFHLPDQLNKLASLTAAPASARASFTSFVSTPASTSASASNSAMPAGSPAQYSPPPTASLHPDSPQTQKTRRSPRSSVQAASTSALPLSRAELDIIARLHNGRVPSLEQTAPPEFPDDIVSTRIINTGNSGPMVVQAGDWKCGVCTFMNWRRRKVCMRCFPYANDVGTILSLGHQRAAQLAHRNGPGAVVPEMTPPASRAGSEGSINPYFYHSSSNSNPSVYYSSSAAPAHRRVGPELLTPIEYDADSYFRRVPSVSYSSAPGSTPPHVHPSLAATRDRTTSLSSSPDKHFGYGMTMAASASTPPALPPPGISRTSYEASVMNASADPWTPPNMTAGASSAAPAASNASGTVRERERERERPRSLAFYPTLT